jgi:hypothetical protein
MRVGDTLLLGFYMMVGRKIYGLCDNRFFCEEIYCTLYNFFCIEILFELELEFGYNGKLKYLKWHTLESLNRSYLLLSLFLLS